jgi:hypothetical protein
MAGRSVTVEDLDLEEYIYKNPSVKVSLWQVSRLNRADTKVHERINMNTAVRTDVHDEDEVFHQARERMRAKLAKRKSVPKNL